MCYRMQIQFIIMHTSENIYEMNGLLHYSEKVVFDRASNCIRRMKITRNGRNMYGDLEQTN